MGEASVRPLVVDAAREWGLGGVAVGVITAGDAPVAECLGLADRVSGRHINADTIFRIASVSKTLTAIGVMQLRDEGLLDLDDPVNDVLESFRIDVPAGAPPVTVRHLLTHTAGLGELPNVKSFASRAAWGAGAPNDPPFDLARLYDGVLRAEVAPGSKWAYANHGFAVLGQVVEDVSGVAFADYMRERVLRPIGMEHAGFVRADVPADRLATGYHWVFGRLRPLKDYDLVLMGPGSALASLTDMLRYAEWLVAPGQGRQDGQSKVLDAETLREMQRPQYHVDPRFSTAMGLAFFVDRFGSHPVCGHDGNNPGFASALLVAPDDGVGVVALTNNSSFIGAHQLADRILRRLLDVPEPAHALPKNDIAPQPHLWRELVGHYVPEPGFLTNFRNWQFTGGEVQVFIRNRRLCLRALSPLPLLRRGIELHAVDAADPYLFALEAHGLVAPVGFGTSGGPGSAIDRLTIGAPSNVTLHRRSPWRSSRNRLTAAGLGGVAVVAARRARRR